MMQASITSISEVRGTPAIGAYLAPVYLTGEFATPVQPRYSYGRFLNRLSHRAVDLMMWTMFRSWWNEARRQTLNLKPLGRFHDFRTVNGKPAPLLFAISEAMVPRPRDWPDYAHMTGNWYLDGDDDWTPPPDLGAFLDSGPQPIYIGFGSMPLGHLKKRAPVLLEALRLSGQRAVFARGWGGWGEELTAELGASAHIIDFAPHRHLFPLMAGVVG
jgi:sterol 3beta-glucosyltransferase